MGARARQTLQPDFHRSADFLATTAPRQRISSLFLCDLVVITILDLTTRTILGIRPSTTPRAPRFRPIRIAEMLKIDREQNHEQRPALERAHSDRDMLFAVPLAVLVGIGIARSPQRGVAIFGDHVRGRAGGPCGGLHSPCAYRRTRWPQERRMVWCGRADRRRDDLSRRAARDSRGLARRMGRRHSRGCAVSRFRGGDFTRNTILALSMGSAASAVHRRLVARLGRTVRPSDDSASRDSLGRGHRAFV